MADAGLELWDVKVSFNDNTLLNVSAQIPPGTVLTIMGPSGSGKSTLLACLTGTLAKEFTWSGQIRLNGRDIGNVVPQNRKLGILFQDHLLFPHLSVGENLAFGLSQSVRGRKERSAIIERALEDIGLDGFADRDPDTLSGGQKARVSLMRTLLSEPEALLLDEPFSRLDAELRDQVRKLVFAHAKTRELPVLLVTHDKEDAETAGGEIISLD